MNFPEAILATGLAHLRRSDPVIRAVIDQIGPFRLELERDPFRALVRAIIAQQISGRAADSIYGRLISLLKPNRLNATRLAALTIDQLRSAGVSPQKASYLLDLAGKVRDKHLRLGRLPDCSDLEVINALVEVKGIGVWTAQMFLIFSLGRLDVFPEQDLGVRSALRNLYKLTDLPDLKTSHQIAQVWRPYATIASWYCWRSLDLADRNG